MCLLQLRIFLDARLCHLVGCRVADSAGTFTSQEEAVGCEMQPVAGTVRLTTARCQLQSVSICAAHLLDHLTTYCTGPILQDMYTVSVVSFPVQPYHLSVCLHCIQVHSVKSVYICMQIKSNTLFCCLLGIILCPALKVHSSVMSVKQCKRTILWFIVKSVTFSNVINLRSIPIFSQCLE